MPNRTYVRHLLLPERCSGVSPSQAQAAKSQPLFREAAAGDSATSAIAVVGPMPGIVASRRAVPSSRAPREISTSSRLMPCSSDRSVSTRHRERQAARLRQTTLRILYLCNELGSRKVWERRAGEIERSRELLRAPP